MATIISMEFFRYVQHKPDCDWLMPMWNQGPCSCGLAELALLHLNTLPVPEGVRLVPCDKLIALGINHGADCERCCALVKEK